MALSSEHVHERLAQAARRHRLLCAVRHTLSGLAVGLALMIFLLLADSEFHFGTVTRWAAFFAVIAPVAGGLGWALRTALPRVSEASMARRIETATDGLNNTLISAVQFDKELPVHSPFRKAIFQEMNDPFPRVNWALVFDLKLFKRLAAAFAASLLLLGGYAFLWPHYFANSAARILLPARFIPPLTHTRIAQLTPGDTRVINGHPLHVTAQLEGDVPNTIWITYREPGAPWQKVLMDRELGTNTFSFDWKELHDPLAYRIVAGDATSPIHQVAVRPRTALIHRQASIEPPPYTGLKTETRCDFAALGNVLPGSRVTFTLEFNSALAELHADAPLAPQKNTPTEWTATGRFKSNTAVRLEWRDTDSLKDSEVIQVATMADEPPRITVAAPPEGKEIFATAQDSLTVTFQATDNFGLGSVVLYRSTDENAEAERLAEWKDAAGKKSYSATLKISLAKYAQEGRVTFALVAKDQNDVSGPGVTWSRPIVVTLRSREQIEKAEADAGQKALGGLEALVKLQTTNLQQTDAALKTLRIPNTAKPALKPLLDREAQIADAAEKLNDLSPEIQSGLQSLSKNEFPAALLSLRTAAGASDFQQQTSALTTADAQQAVILARLKGLLKAAENEAAKAKIRDLISGVEELLRRERELLHATAQAKPADSGPLSQRQDALAEKASAVRKNLERGSQDPSAGDTDFRDRLAKAAATFKEAAIYEKMLTASEQLQNAAFPTATATQKEVIARLAKIIESLNQWQVANAKHEAEVLKQQAHELAQKLEKLAEIQKGIVEKSKELARKGDDARPEDAAVAEAMQKAKEELAKTVEQMLTDANLFPDIKPYNQLRGELTQIYEDVIQQDKEDALAGKIKATEIAVQKEEGLLAAIEKTTKMDEDLEMWLPNKNDAEKWLCENFDKTEMPDMPNVPLPDAFEDLVGDLLTEQEGLDQEAMDAASNQALAQIQQGWGVADGPMPGFSAQGKSGNTRPNKNEQFGRSSGGREGMANGEMVGNTASNLEGTKTQVRRSNDSMQQGHINDNGGIQQARATGGGKSGGFSDRNGMDGNAPLRASNAPRLAANDALAVKQALLSEKTSKMAAQANLLYLRARGLPGVAQLMDNAQAALKEGRMEDFRDLHQRIVTQLKEVQGNILPGDVSTLNGGDRARTREKALLGGDEGQAPAPYQKAVIDYFRSLQDAK